MFVISGRYPNVTQDACDKYAQGVAGGPIRPLEWQGYHSYTVESLDGLNIVQFRSEDSPLRQEIVDLAQKIHPDLVPTMLYLGCRPVFLAMLPLGLSGAAF